MNKLIFISLINGLPIFFIFLFILWLISPKPANPVNYIIPDPAKTYKKPVNWKGTPYDQKSRFLNHQYPFYFNYINILIWVPSHFYNLIRNQFIYFDVIKQSNKDILDQKDTLIWLGHASFFLNLNGIKILIDPHFYNTVLYKRHSENPILPDLFTGIDYILLSHNHGDHFNEKSLKKLLKLNSQVTFLTGLKMDELISKVISKNATTITAEWFQKYNNIKSIDIYFVPSRHYCNKIGYSFNKHLWGGFILSYQTGKGENKKIYFGGDSGYGTHFGDIKTLFEPDLAILGIGAYKPAWFMHPNHMSPLDALKTFKETGAKEMIPMHYGTFNLSNEMMDNPLKELLKNSGNQQIKNLKPGEIFKL